MKNNSLADKNFFLAFGVMATNGKQLELGSR
jgi:hypothetical protein